MVIYIRHPKALSWAVGLLLPISCLTEGTYGYRPPAGGEAAPSMFQANVSTSSAPQPLHQAWSRGPPTGFVSGRDQASGKPLDTTDFKFKGAALDAYPDTTFQINTGCSPSAPNDNLATGALVYGVSNFNSSQRTYYFTYNLTTLSDADKPQYKSVLAGFIERLQNMVDGEPKCNTPISAVNNLEASANYKGDLLSDVMTLQDSDACCQACKSKQGCNVFVWCPASGGCDTGGGSKFPYQGCQLKSQPGLTAGSQPEAWGRGPGTTDFASADGGVVEKLVLV
ncbi:hypothetical protein COCSUDRAFT_57736 [Coccomyxa subellipsoidea C-169]|uniref:Apple domain-containing protein n=1 Tax=Coccomyxa subellipsoidea (strain C-169) TaxID=574566 RepID=I0YQC4_COCSC|nr:hypothetical protein COCSUDRAFT_57736 [Coccomyxa subellipsoidea C-169]EIE20593.1 hypothetical protein COCSUDRAFT_57736 [Coccomyxa subellipsoidea C-169]|eukprot:XP_005645137.1 hypothetical protein COCSUDRAFT_57736 [Coccomyxa subellipsoidea C-169]